MHFLCQVLIYYNIKVIMRFFLERHFNFKGNKCGNGIVDNWIVIG